MNLYIILGIIVIAIGSGLTTYGIFIKNNETSDAIQEKIDSVISKIDTVKDTTTDPSTSKSLEIIEDDFKSWASQFIKNKEAIKLSIEQDKLSITQSQINSSNVVRPVFEHTINVLKQIATAYNKESGSNISIEINTLPENMYSGDTFTYIGKFAFSENFSWSLFIYASRSGNYNISPSLEIDISNRYNPDLGISTPSSEHLSIRMHSGIVVIDGDRFPLKRGIYEEYNINEYKGKVKLLLQKLFEKQLLSLE